MRQGHGSAAVLQGVLSTDADRAGRPGSREAAAAATGVLKDGRARRGGDGGVFGVTVALAMDGWAGL